MTRDEILEDLKIGEIYKFNTESGEVFVGKVLDMGTTALKINLCDGKKTKRISYNRILEYDIEEVEIPKSEIKDNNLQNSNSGNAGNDKLLSEYTINDIEAFRKEWKAKINSDYKQDYNRVNNMLDYAKKMKEYKLNNYRVVHAIKEYEILAQKDNAFYAFIAIIYHEFKDYLNAEKYYRLAKCNIGTYEIDTQIKNEQHRKGIIRHYNKESKYGFIEDKDDKSNDIFFYIAQVKDVTLQKELTFGTLRNYHVTYIKGINLNGDIAADLIELDKSITDKLGPEVSQVEYSHKGVISDYNLEYHVGEIQSDDKFFKFIDREIMDPLLLAKINSGYNEYFNLKVRFNLKDFKNKKRRCVEKVAGDVIGEKKYSEKEIEELINRGLLSKQEVDKWISKDNDSFTAVPYVPLKKLNEVDLKGMKTEQYPERVVRGITEQHNKKTEENVNSLQEINSGLFYTKSDNEKKAIALIIPEKSVNPFLSLGKLNVRKNYYYQRAHEFMVGIKDLRGNIIGVDLNKAEDYYIKAIRSNDRIESAVANLAGYVYIKLGGSYIIKGLQLLEAYGHLLTNEKLMNLRVQLIDKSENSKALELILLDAIPKCSKANTRWQYMMKLAGIYYKQQAWERAAAWFDRSLELLNKTKNQFPQYENLRKSNLKLLIVSNYCYGKRELARSQAQEFLNNKPQEQSDVIKSILEGTFELNKYQGLIVDSDEFQLEDEYFDLDNNNISQYLNYVLQEVNLSSTFSKIKDVYSKIQGGIFTGNSTEVKNVIEFIQTNILGKNKLGLNAANRSAIYIGIAKIIFDSRNNNFKNGNENKVAIEELKKYIGRYARYAADALVVKFATVDSIRFLYIQALKNLVKKDTGNITTAINMLVATFFTTKENLPKELDINSLSIMGGKYKEDYYKERCVSIKDLIIATFMLQDKQEYVDRILKKIYEDKNLKNSAIDTLENLANQNKTVTSWFDFENLWQFAKSAYDSILQQIGKEITDSISEYHMAESTRQHIQRIEELLNAKTLWNQDEKILGRYLSILHSLVSTLEKYTVEEKIEGFRTIEADIDRLREEILTSPTELCFDYVYIRLDELKNSILGDFDELYISSVPECTITLSSDSVYVKDDTVRIAIAFKNADNKQDADAVKIELEGSRGAYFTQCEKQFTSIRSGDVKEYIAVFSLSNDVIKDGQFEVKVKMQYSYRESVDNINIFTTNKILPVNITDKNNFIKIENKYDRIIRGSGIDINTPELFKGRNELINSICASMSTNDGIMTKNRGIILWGQRRVGKNSVKDYLKEKIKNTYPNAYIIIELGSIGNSRNIREVLATIVNKTENTLEIEYNELYEQLIAQGVEFNGAELEDKENFMPLFVSFMDSFSSRLRKISEREQNIPLYFIDEFSYLYEWIEKGEINGKEFMRFWKSFIQDYGVCAIIIAQDNIPVWKSMYENEFACMNHDNEITYLDFKGAKELICEPCQNSNKDLFTPDAVKLIYDWTKGSAYLIVIFCKHIIDYLNENYTERATKTIVQIVFEKEFIDKKEMFFAGDFEPQIQDVANVGEEGKEINYLNEELLKEIASKTINSARVRIDEIEFLMKYEQEKALKVFKRLKERKIIEVEGDMYCMISMPLLKFYLLREQSLLKYEVLNKLTR